MQMPFARPQRAPIQLSRADMTQVYALVAVAMGLTAVGIYAGMTFALPIIASGWLFILFLAELAIVLTARYWMRSSPMNYALFALFPLLSGLTITPLLMNVLLQYPNGPAILLNAAVATALLSGAAAIVASTTSMDLGVMGRALLFGLIGLIVIGLLQAFIPAMRTGTVELLVSGAGVVIFSGFLAYDIQRLRSMAHSGESPFMLALSLYLDIFNLFIYVLRLVMALSGGRRNSW